MNGIIFNELDKFAASSLGEAQWQQLIKAAKLPHGPRLAINEYPDSELMALLAALSSGKGDRSVSATLETFGEFIAPDLLQMAQDFIDPSWKTIDLVANTEGAIHTIYRGAWTHTNPPRLDCVKGYQDEVTVHYSSSRKLCAFAKGIIRGVAKYFGESVIISEPQCMHRGDPECELIVTLSRQ